MTERTGAARLAVWGLLAALAGCGLGHSTPTPPPTPGALDDDDHLAWAESEPYMVVVRKSCRTLDLYRQGYRIRSFPAVFGLSSAGSKLYEGDLRTPSGLYAIIDKRPHPRWHQFLLLDYPNLQDLHRYRLAMEDGRIPLRGDRHAGVGGAIGIHGTDKPGLNERGVDWTFGCISIGNRDIEDLASLVPVGTLVLIED